MRAFHKIKCIFFNIYIILFFIYLFFSFWESDDILKKEYRESTVYVHIGA